MSTQINESSCAGGAVVDPSSGSGASPAVFHATAPLEGRSEHEGPIAIHKSALQSVPVGDPKPLHPGKHSSSNNNNNNNNKNHRNKRRRRGKQEPPSIAPPEACSVCKIVKDDEPPKYKCPKCRAPYCSVACCRQHKTVCPRKVGESSSATAATATTATTSTAGATKSASALHQTAPIIPTNGDGNESDTDDHSDDDDDDSSLEDGWKITDDMKVALRNSTWLRTELQDGGLRDMIASVVRSEKKFKSFHRRQKQGRYRNRHHKNNNNNNNNNKHGMGKNPPKRNFQPQPRHPHEELGAKRADNKNFDIFVDKLLVLADVLERQRHDGPMEFATGEAATSGGMSSNRNEEELEEWLRRKWDPGMAPPSLTLRPRRKAIPKFESIDVSSSSEDEDDVSGDESLESNKDADAKRDGES